MAKTPLNFDDAAKHDKYNNFEAELKQVKDYLSNHNVTATMAAVALDIYRPNLCRHKISLESQGLLKVTHNARCKETGHFADYLTCNPDLLKKGVKNGG